MSDNLKPEPPKGHTMDELVKLLGLDKWTKAYSKMNKAYSDMIFEKTMAKLERYRFLAFSSMFVITGFFLSYVNREVKDLKEIVRGELTTFKTDISASVTRELSNFKVDFASLKTELFEKIQQIQNKQT